MTIVSQLFENNLCYKAKQQYLDNNLITKVTWLLNNNLIAKQLIIYIFKTYLQKVW